MKALISTTFAFLASITFMSGASASEAPEGSGTELLEACTALLGNRPSDWSMQGYCIGLVAGVTGVVSRQDEISAADIHVCAPEGITKWNYVQIVYKYLEENPEELHLPETLLVMKAASEAFPCE